MTRKWRDLVDKGIKQHLEREIKESFKHKEAYRHSENPANAQLWCAIGDLTKQIFDINLKLNYLESALKDIVATREEEFKKVVEEIKNKEPLKREAKVKKKAKTRRK